MVEAALVAPLLVLLVLGAVGIGRLVQARMALDAATREAARAAVLSPMPRVGADDDAAWSTARTNGRSQGEQVAESYGLPGAGISLSRESTFEPGNWVRASGEVDVEAIHLPFMRRFFGEGASSPTVTLRSQHWERIDRYRSRLP
jgi:hypothetical protein